MDALTLPPAPLHYPQRHGLNCGNGDRARPGCPLRVKSAVLAINPPLPIYPDQRTSSDRSSWSGSCHFRTSASQQKNSHWITASPSGPTGIAGISMPGRLAVQRPTSVAPPTTPSARGECLTSASVRENPPGRYAVIIDYQPTKRVRVDRWYRDRSNHHLPDLDYHQISDIPRLPTIWRRGIIR